MLELEPCGSLIWGNECLEALSRHRAATDPTEGGVMCIRINVALPIVVLAGAVLYAEGQARPRLFVSDSTSWEQSGGFAATKGGAGGFSSGGARPQTAEIIKTVSERCPEVTVTMKPDKANYVLLLEHEGGTIFFQKDNKFALFNGAGDALRSGSTRNLGNAVKDACAALLLDWKAKGVSEPTPTPAPELKR
jgi:hypothetical protein